MITKTAIGLRLCRILESPGNFSQRLLCIAGDATVTIAHRHTPREQLKAHTQLAEIIIVAAGKCPLMVVWGEWHGGVIPALMFGAFKECMRVTQRKVYGRCLPTEVCLCIVTMVACCTCLSLCHTTVCPSPDTSTSTMEQHLYKQIGAGW